MIQSLTGAGAAASDSSRATVRGSAVRVKQTGKQVDVPDEEQLVDGCAIGDDEALFPMHALRSAMSRSTSSIVTSLVIQHDRFLQPQVRIGLVFEQDCHKTERAALLVRCVWFCLCSA